MVASKRQILFGGPIPGHMLTSEELVDFARQLNPKVDAVLITLAYEHAEAAHRGQKRLSGEPYITHPVEVARLTAAINPEATAIAAALLHDTVEDTSLNHQSLLGLFGQEVASLVDGLTKIDKISDASMEATEAESHRKLLLATTSDVRVLIIKLADRLHNMRTVGFMDNQEKREKFCRETTDVFAPLAGRMGMIQVRDELEDLAFQTLSRERYAMILEQLEAGAERYHQLCAEIKQDIDELLVLGDIKAEVTFRIKRPFSISQKMDANRLELGQLHDIYGFRIVVEETEDCYRALGAMHVRWPIVAGRFKDFISSPKENDYRSLHTTIVGPAGTFVELQIRTLRMHLVAEHGIAAHALYKDQSGDAPRPLESESSAYAKLKSTIAQLAEGGLSPEEFIEHTKLELFRDEIFALSPKGDVVVLPRGANAVDFAYAVHTKVGNKCSSCKINGQFRPLSTQIRNGFQVEIITDASQKAPPESWLAIAKTGKARHAIRKARRDWQRAESADFARSILTEAFERREKTYSDEQILAILPQIQQPSVLDALGAVSEGTITGDQIFDALFPLEKTDSPKFGMLDRQREPDWYPVPGVSGLRFRPPDQLEPKANQDRLIHRIRKITYPEFGGPVPGDRIIGVFDDQEEVCVYSIDSMSLANLEDKVWIDARWEGDELTERTITRIHLTSLNAPGSLLAIAKVVAENDGNVELLKMEAQTPDYHDITIDLGVWSILHLSSILSQLRAKPTITHADRVVG